MGRGRAVRSLVAVVVSAGVVIATGVLAYSPGMAGATIGPSSSVSSPAAGGFGAVAPARILDTRSGLGAPAGPAPAGGLIPIKVPGPHGIPASGVSAVAVNLIAVSATRPGYLTAYANGTTRPHANVLNFSTGQPI